MKYNRRFVVGVVLIVLISGLFAQLITAQGRNLEMVYPSEVTKAIQRFRRTAATGSAPVQVISYFKQTFREGAFDCPSHRLSSGTIKGYSVTLAYRGVVFNYAVDSLDNVVLCFIRWQ